MPANASRAAKITIVQGDTSPALRAKLLGAGGVIQSLLAAHVFLTIKPQQGPSPIIVDDEEITIEDAAAGIVRYDWAPGVTDRAGTYVARFRVVLGDGRQISFPNGWTFVVRIIPAL